MSHKIFFQVFVLGLVRSEWVEIKVVNKGLKKIAEPKIAASTPASYEAILVRPQGLFEISATTPFQESVPQFQEALFSVVLPNSTSSKYLVESENLRENSTALSDNENFGRVQKTEEYELQEDNNYTENNFSKENIDMGDDNESYVVEEISEANEPFQIASVLKHVQKMLLNYRGKSFKGKLTLLKNLRDNLLYEIKSRMFELWLPSTPQNGTEPRGYKEYADDHYHMDFPSNEGALMTIGFLTFAVFLIKLVLKLIYTLKYKQQYYFQTTTTTAASVFLKRNQRDVTQEQLEQSMKILQYIEEYPLS